MTNDPFLKLCAIDIYEKHSSDLSSVSIVFPGKRSIIYFKKYFSEIIEKPIFFPHCTTIQELFSEQTRSHIPEQTVLVYLLYKSYITHTKSSESFDSFYSWGEMLLQDFHDIDMYMVNAKALFSNISSLQEMQDSFQFLGEEQIAHISRFWNVIEKPSDSSSKQNFISIWSVLYAVYCDFSEELKKQSYAYSGMAAREVIEQAQQTGSFGGNNKHYCFIGFNALNSCEVALFRLLHAGKKASFYWDYDVHYTSNSYLHEAGFFIKKHIQEFPNALDSELFTSFSKPKQISIIATPQTVSQVKVCAHWITTAKDTKDAAIVLANEQLIHPLLTSIPESYSYNISLGYPISATKAYAFCMALADMHAHEKQQAFYYKDVFRVCESRLIPTHQKPAFDELRNTISTNNYVYISHKTHMNNEAFAPYCTPTKTAVEFLHVLENCILTSAEHLPDTDIEKSILYLIYKEVQHILFLVSEYAIPLENKKFVTQLLSKALSSKNIAIQGEPLEDLQIMGVLETRTLDFSRLIILSMNEGVFPRTSVGSSFIPYSLRTGFGMPTIQEQGAMYSYYFYRLIQRASDITLVYSTLSDEVGKGEMSRYIMQMLYAQNPLHTITQKELAFSVGMQQDNSISIPKLQESIDYISAYFDGTKTISPSAIATYLTCRLRFYFRYIRRLQKPLIVDEMPGEHDYGNIFHYSMEDVYASFHEKEVTKQDIEAILANTDLITKTISKHCDAILHTEKNATDFASGMRTLLEETICTYIKNTLKFDMQRAPFYIVGLEHESSATIPIGNNAIQLGGSIDRLEKNNGRYTVIDYKTGHKDLSAQSVASLFDRTQKIKSAILQSCIYSYIISKNHASDVQNLLYYIREIHSSKLPEIHISKIPLTSYYTIQEEFEQLLTETLEELCNPDVPFSQTENTDTCTWCDFTVICNRKK